MGWSGFLLASSREGLTKTRRGTRSLPGLSTPLPAAPLGAVLLLSWPSAKSNPAPAKDFCAGFSRASRFLTSGALRGKLAGKNFQHRSP